MDQFYTDFTSLKKKPLESRMDGKDNIEVYKFHYNPATLWFDIPYRRKIMIGSANGLLFWHNDSVNAKRLFICNPIIREYIKVACAEDFQRSPNPFVRYGFGANKISGQHKVLRASRLMEMKFEYHVYALGMGPWRRIHPSINHNHPFLEVRPFISVNEKIHWLNTVLSPYIFSVDLETELFDTCTSPLPVTLNKKYYFSLFAMRDSLCLCESTHDYKEITVWLVKEDKFWEKEFVIRYNPPGYYYCQYFWLPVKVVNIFKDGDILVKWLNAPYATRLGKMGTWDMLECWDCITIHTPSFLSLKSYELENVISF